MSVSKPNWLYYSQSYFRKTIVYKIVGRRMVNTEVFVLQMMTKNVGVIVLAMKISPKAWRAHHKVRWRCIRVTSLDTIRTIYESYRKRCCFNVREMKKWRVKEKRNVWDRNKANDELISNGKTNGLVNSVYVYMQKLPVYFFFLNLYPVDSTTLGSGEAWPPGPNF